MRNYNYSENYCIFRSHKRSEIEKKHLNQKSISSGAKFNKPSKTGLHFYYFEKKKKEFLYKTCIYPSFWKRISYKDFLYTGKTKEAKELRKKIGNKYISVGDIKMVYIRFSEIIIKKFYEIGSCLVKLSFFFQIIVFS